MCPGKTKGDCACLHTLHVYAGAPHLAHLHQAACAQLYQWCHCSTGQQVLQTQHGYERVLHKYLLNKTKLQCLLMLLKLAESWSLALGLLTPSLCCGWWKERDEMSPVVKMLYAVSLSMMGSIYSSLHPPGP